MVGKKQLLELAKQALVYSQADQTQVTLNLRDTYLSRYANNTIHQNIHEDASQLSVKAVVGKRIGIATTNQLDDASIRRAVDEAVAVARLQKPNPDFVSLPEPAPVSEVNSFSEATASLTAEKRAQAVYEITSQAEQSGIIAAGAYSTTIAETVIVNSLGVEVYQPSTAVNLTCTMMSDSGQGYAARVSRNVNEINAAEVGREALHKCLINKDQIALEPGEYTVILDRYAVHDLITYLGFMGFNGAAYQEGRSFLSGKLGQQVVGSNITIWDDGTDERSLASAVDGEGVPKQKVMLIDRGVASNVVYDSYSANKYGVSSTGHAPRGVPRNLFLKPGEQSLEEMLSQTERGIFVTRFHYVRVVHPLRTTITGMTRGGTFLIEDGRISRALKNMRFTQSIAAALTNVESIGNDALLLGAAVVPHLKIHGFRFTGVTEH